ncbi:MAG: DMT family transporter [Paracoccaceae bacterium]
MQHAGAATPDNARVGIFFILVGMSFMSVNDMLIKQLSGAYPLHQMVLTRSLIGVMFSLVILQFEGGFRVLRTDRIGLHIFRALLVVVSNLTFFAALAVLPLADTTTLFFVSPLFITVMSVIFLGEKVGIRRVVAVLIGFVGALVMMRPEANPDVDTPSRWILLLPVISALTYASMQILTRKLGPKSKASAMALYIQVTFICVSLIFFLIAGDGRYAEGQDSEILKFLLREWVWPSNADWPLFALLGLVSAVIAYSLTEAYRSAAAATVAPFEYIALPLAIFWGWTVFGDIPDIRVLLGVALIAGSGIYVFFREGVKSQTR